MPHQLAREREANVLVKVREFFQGGSELLPLNPEWDRWVIDRFSAGDLASLASLTTPGVVADGGRGGQEVRTWLAAFATLAHVGPYEVTTSFYAPAEIGRASCREGVCQYV